MEDYNLFCAFDPESPACVPKGFPVRPISIITIPPEDVYQFLMSGACPPENFRIPGISWFTLGVNQEIQGTPIAFFHFTGIMYDFFSTREKANLYLWKVVEMAA